MVFRTMLLRCYKDFIPPFVPEKFYNNIKQQSRYFKRMQFKRLAAKYYGRPRNCYAVGIMKVKRAMRFSTQHRAVKEETLDRLYESRVAAACLEHGMDKTYFLTSLAEMDVNLNRETLSNLAIYEPRSFQSLVELVKVRSLEIGLQSTKLGSPLGTETRGIWDEVKKAS